jgi:hypothetical protein
MIKVLAGRPDIQAPLRVSVSPWLKSAVLLIALLLGVATSHAADAPFGQTFFEKRCGECHDIETKKGNLDLTSLSTDLSDRATFNRWVKVHDMIESGEMPPKKKARPEAAETSAVLNALSGKLIAAEKTRTAGSGRATFRRLTRAEYEYTLQDLLDLKGMPLRENLPADGSAFGFNKISDALDISHVQVAKYMEVAQKVLDTATATRGEAPLPFFMRIYPATQGSFKNGLDGGDAVLLKEKHRDTAWPLIETQGQIKEQRVQLYNTVLNPSKSAVGVFRHTDEAFNPGFQNFSPIIPGRYRIKLSVWSFEWDKADVQPGKRTQGVGLRKAEGPIGFFDAPSPQSREYEVEAWLEQNDMLLFNTSSLEQVLIYNQPGRAKNYRGPGVAIDWIEVEGPLNQAWPPPSHVKLFGDLPIRKLWDLPAAQAALAGAKEAEKKAAAEAKKKKLPAPPSTIPAGPPMPPPLPARQSLVKLERRRDSRWPGRDDHFGKPDGTVWGVVSSNPDADAKRLLADFLPRAFRRPVADETVMRYAAIVAERMTAGDVFEDAMKTAYQTALCSPEFLFRIEPASGKLDDFAVANRLSYLFWNSMPDGELMNLAAKGELRSAPALRKQVARMLADPRSQRFIRDFLDQWLELDQISSTTPDKTLYPEFKPYMQDCMVAETRAFFRRLVDQNLGVRNLVDSDFAMLNAELAKLYSVDAKCEGDALAPVKLPPGSHRGGLLTQGSILKITANGTVTSPVKRGAWVMDRLLGKRPDPPPPSVSAVDPDLRGTTTIREQLDKHRNNAACASCHVKMDPPGFAMESFDVIGRWRDRYRSKEVGDPVNAKVGEGHYEVKYRLGMPVDCTGQTVDGTAFRDIEEFKRILLKDERQIARNFVQRLAVYATGGEVGFADRKAIETILDKSGQGYPIRSLIEELVVSELFLTK